MKIHAQEILKRNIQFLLFVVMVVLSVITIVLNLRAITQSSRPLIIGIDANGTRIVTENNDPIFKTEAVSYVQRFLFNLYNFDSETFIKRIGFITSLMSEELWQKKRTEILELKNKVEKDNVALSSEIKKITLDESGSYHALVVVSEKNRLNQEIHQVMVKLVLKQTARTSNNPYGIEVDGYEEAVVRD